MLVYCANKNLICLICDACHERASLQIGYARFQTSRLAVAAADVFNPFCIMCVLIYIYIGVHMSELYNCVLCNKHVVIGTAAQNIFIFVDAHLLTPSQHRI